MNKITATIVIVLAVSAQLTAQEYQYVPFPDSGVVWSEVYYVHDENSDEKTSYECFAVNGEDTIINGQAYTKVYHFYDSVFNKNTATSIGGIREDSLKRVYYKGEQVHSLKPQLQYAKPEDEIILFDFNIEEEDTIDFVNSDAPGMVKFIVSRIDTVEFSGVLRKQFFFKDYDSSLWGFSWIEGIGSTRGLLFVSGTIPMSRNNRLICFFENKELVFHDTDYTDCFEGFVGIDERELNKKISLSSNPVKNNEITFNFYGSTFESILIYNLNGSLLGSYKVNSTNCQTIALPHLTPGIYLYKALTPNGIYASGKFVL